MLSAFFFVLVDIGGCRGSVIGSNICNQYTHVGPTGTPENKCAKCWRWSATQVIKKLINAFAVAA